MLRELTLQIYGVKLVGAGGSGFLMAIGNSLDARNVLAEMLATDREFGQGYVVGGQLFGDLLRVHISH